MLPGWVFTIDGASPDLILIRKDEEDGYYSLCMFVEEFKHYGTQNFQECLFPKDADQLTCDALNLNNRNLPVTVHGRLGFSWDGEAEVPIPPVEEEVPLKKKATAKLNPFGERMTELEKDRIAQRPE